MERRDVAVADERLGVGGDQAGIQEGQQAEGSGAAPGAPLPQPTPRLGLAIAARIIGNAVRRNRIKRLVRESFRQHQHELPALDIVVNARNGARDADNAAIVRSLEKHWRAVIKQCASS